MLTRTPRCLNSSPYCLFLEIRDYLSIWLFSHGAIGRILGTSWCQIFFLSIDPCRLAPLSPKVIITTPDLFIFFKESGFIRLNRNDRVQHSYDKQAERIIFYSTDIY